MGKTKSKLSRGEPALGGWVMIGHPSSAEIMAGEGFDWLGVDMEHTSTGIQELHVLALALKGTDCDLLVRLHSCDPVLANLVLDHGAAGIIVPSVSTPVQAAQAVAMAKYPPEGTRSVALCRAADFGRKFEAYFRNHNREVLVAVMIEHRDALPHLDALLGTPGLDAALIGPYALSASLGLAGQLQHPKVLGAQQEILEACRKHGVAPGLHVVPVDPAELQRRLEQGFRFVACGLDTLFIQHGCRTMLSHLKGYGAQRAGH